MSVFDFNALQDIGHTSSAFMWKGVADVHGTNGVLAVDGLPAQARVQQVRSSLSRQLPGAQVFLPRSIPLYGLRPTHLSGKSARHGDVSARRRVQALSCWHPWPSLPKHLGRRQRDQRLAHLGRLRPGAGGQGQTTLCRRELRLGLATERLRPGFHHHRSVSFAVSLGAISQTQGGHQSAHPDGLAWQYPLFYPHHSRQRARCQYPRRVAFTTRCLLRHGSGLHRLRSSLYLHQEFGLLLWFVPKAISITADSLTATSTSPQAYAAIRESSFKGRKRPKPIPMRFAASVTSIPIPGSAWSS